MERRAKDHNTDLFRELGIKGRDEEAWGVIYSVYWGALVRFISMKFTAIDREDVEDIAVEAMIKLWLKREVVARHDIPKDWLFRCAKNDALDFLKKRERRKLEPLAESHEQVPDDSAALYHLEPDERTEAAKQAVARLPPETRKALRMKYLDGLGNQKIAKLLGKSAQTIANQLLTGMRKLQQWMDVKESMPKKDDSKKGNDE
ncbi:RNA polymerase sigma factor [Parapedobacter deserti]|uniref:RNA polymerase sigma factor n=1 Tax=Parapedobacter deserti TaxID=1912957 RepID=A0ABV7JN73_9SPHI